MINYKIGSFAKKNMRTLLLSLLLILTSTALSKEEEIKLTERTNEESTSGKRGGRPVPIVTLCGNTLNLFSERNIENVSITLMDVQGNIICSYTNVILTSVPIYIIIPNDVEHECSIILAYGETIYYGYFEMT